MNFITLLSKEWIIYASQHRYALFRVLSRLWATCYIFIEVKSWPRAYTSLAEWVCRFFLCPRNNSSTLEREYTRASTCDGLCSLHLESFTLADDFPRCGRLLRIVERSTQRLGYGWTCNEERKAWFNYPPCTTW